MRRLCQSLKLRLFVYLYYNIRILFSYKQVNAAGETAQGTGPNKKLAKRAAAESLLQTLGYFRPSAQPGKPALKNTSSVNVASSNLSSTATGAGDNGNHLNSVDKPSKDSTEGKTSPSTTIPNGEKPKKVCQFNVLILYSSEAENIFS